MNSPTVVVSGMGVVVAALRLLTGAGVVVDNQSVMLSVALVGAMYFTPINISLSTALRERREDLTS